MNLLMKKFTCLEVSPLGYSCLTRPGDSPVISLPLSIGIAPRLVIFQLIHPAVTWLDPNPSVIELTSTTNKIEGPCIPYWAETNAHCQFDEATCSCRQKDHRY